MLTADQDERPRYTAKELWRCAERELSLRRQVYPNRVMTGRMSKHHADSEIAKMAEIAEHFAELAKAERLI